MGVGAGGLLTLKVLLSIFYVNLNCDVTWKTVSTACNNITLRLVFNIK